ncbi:MAG: hypothetical protein E7204_04135 [Veillonella sp.]|uniref:DNA polymerase III subunit n=1 Tax=Veillonella sp. TaxID=1926307 RepID=UPI0025F72F14|nr:hypothetical protein [Veillonella sp.]MBE6080021.1 hypothetical protein [Veillonella sp.]
MSYFEQVIGQKAIIDHLTILVERGTLPHSLLFYGEKGLGKLNTAIGLASLLIGRQVFSADGGAQFLEAVANARQADGESEKKTEAEGLPIYVDGGQAFWLRPMKNMLKVEQWYELLGSYLGRTGGGRRVVIVEDFQTANAVMANAMLKTIEEPPADVFFIIITNQIASVLPTIKSRCMLVPFGPVSNDIITAALRKEGFTEDLQQALGAGQGNPDLVRELVLRGTLPLLEQAVKMLEQLPKALFFTQLSLQTESLKRDDMRELMGWLRLLARDMMALRAGAPDDVLQCPLHKERLLQILSSWKVKTLLTVERETLAAEEALRLNVKAGLVMDGVLLALRQALKEDTQ